MKSLFLILALLAVQTAPQRANGAIEGTVVDSITMAPLANTPISVSAGTLQINTISDQSGRFLLPNISPGPYTIAAALDGYIAPEVSASVFVSEGQISRITLAMVPTGAIRGIVIEDLGAPVADVGVQMMRVTYPNGVPTVNSAGSKTSDDSGSYRMIGLRPGDYYVVATPKAGSPLIRTFSTSALDLSQATMIRLHAGEEVSGVNITLRKGSAFRISGQVMSVIPDSDRGNATAAVTLLPRGGNLQDRAPSGTVSISMGSPANGRFELANILPGMYDVFASLPDNRGYGAAFGRTIVTVNGGDQENVTVTVHRGIDVRGKVTVDGGSSPSFNSIRISLQPEDSAAALPVYQQVSRFQPAINAEGVFTIPSVPEAKYRVQVAFAPPAPTPVRAAVPNRPADPFAPDPTPPAPLVSVALAGAPLGPNAYVADILQSGMTVYNTGISASAQAFDPIEVRVRTDGGSVDGFAMDGKLLPFAGATVVLAPMVQYRDNPALFRVATTDDMGHFTMSGIRPGDYKLLAWESIPPGAYLNAEFLSNYKEKETPVNVSANIRIETKLTVISTNN